MRVTAAIFIFAHPSFVVAHPSFLVDPMGLRAARRTQGRDSRASRAGMIVVIVRAQKSPLAGAGWLAWGFRPMVYALALPLTTVPFVAFVTT